MNPPAVKTLIIDEELHMALMKHCMDLTTAERKVTMRDFVEDAIKEKIKRTTK